MSGAPSPLFGLYASCRKSSGMITASRELGASRFVPSEGTWVPAPTQTLTWSLGQLPPQALCGFPEVPEKPSTLTRHKDLLSSPSLPRVLVAWARQAVVASQPAGSGDR